MQQSEADYSAVGVVPVTPVFFWDFDKTEFKDVLVWAKMQDMRDFDVYKTKHGFHLVAEPGPLAGWDQVQKWLVQTGKMFTEETYIQNCRKQRLRISPKWDKKGVAVSPEPQLLYCHCDMMGHRDKRVADCKQVGYYTATD